jgi:hypothetical protein
MMHKGDNIRVKGIVIAIASILILSTAVMGVSADTAMIWTDKEDYSPGEIVTIYGSGFNANAEITITIVQPNGTVDTITVNSDDNGSFIAYYDINNDDPVGLYTVTATDGTNTASTTFTDAPKVGSVSVSPTSVTVNAGGTATYTVTVNRGSGPGSGGTFTANLSIVGSLPSGTTATFDPNPVSFTPTDNSKTSTLTIQTSTTTSSGTYTFKVKAATSATDFAESGNVTLTVNAPPPPADTTLPVITPNISGTLGNNGWYTSDVIVSWNVSDPESGIASSSGCGTVTINYDTTGETLTCSATNGAGLSNSVSVTIKRDATPPTVYATPDRPADNNGWYNHPLTITFTGDDDTSGIASCDDPVTYNGPDGTGITVDGTCTDNAGNSATGSFTFDYDATPPTVYATPDRPADNNGWYNHPLTITFTGDDDTSGIASCDDPVTYNGPDGTGITVDGTCTDNAGNSATGSFTFDYDATPPTVYATPDRPADNNGWYNHPLTITFTGDDDTSGIASCDDPVTYNGPDGTGITVDGTCTDNAGNSATGSFTFDYDATPPTVNILGISDGDEFDFGDSLPSVTCDATDNLSGIESCTIDPATLPTSVGTHTITVTAKDNAGNEASTSIQYTIVAWTIKGFYQPVDNPPIVNVAKAGSTIPLKFEVFKTVSGEEIEDTNKIVQPLKAQRISCTTLNDSQTDEIELTATGGTSLRYDPTAGQFIYNWKTPTQKDTCWKVTVYTIDGSSISALFRLK